MGISGDHLEKIFQVLDHLIYGSPILLGWILPLKNKSPLGYSPSSLHPGLPIWSL